MNRQLKGAVLTLLGGMCWGMSGSMGQYLFDHEKMDSRWLVPIRLGLAGIILLAYCFAKSGVKKCLVPWRHKLDRRDLLVYGLLGVSLSQFTYFLTIQLSTAAVGTILQDLSPVMILLYSCVRKKRAPRFNEIAAIIFAIGGVALLTTHGNFENLSIPVTALITGVICAVCVSIYNIVPEKLMERYPVLLMQGWAFVMGSAAFFIIFHPWTYNYVPTTMGYIGIAFVVVVGNVMAFPFYMAGVKCIGPEKGILYGFSEPVTAAIISTTMLGSEFTHWDMFGFLSIFIMLVLISVKRKK